MQKRSFKRALITDAMLIAIIVMVYFAAFMGVKLTGGEPALKGAVSGDKVGLQIAADENSDLEMYTRILEEYGVSATFFFYDDSGAMQLLKEQDYATGLIHEREALPVMSYGESGKTISTSIELDRLMLQRDWEEQLKKRLSAGMLILISADNNSDDFEKVIQIVLDKGYTIVKMEEMFTKEN